MSFGPNSPIPLPDLIPGSIVERFWSKVLIRDPNQCWPWMGFCDSRGYGYFRIGKFVYKAHRVSYHLEVEQSNPPQVLHSCDYPSCCNFLHLTGGSHADNMADMVAKGRASSSQYGDSNRLRITPPVGELHPRARLTWRIVREIRARLEAGDKITDLMAIEYGVKIRHLYRIATKASWVE